MNADGCHLRQKDVDLIEAKKLLKKIIGITCHNSIKLAKAIDGKADYLAFGAFFISVQKKQNIKKSKFVKR